MLDITKTAEPKALVEYRAQPDAQYDGPQFTPVKSEIRDGLLQDQGHLCAYCMQRIKAHKMKVEHWQSQSACPSRQLDYANMLGCCMGNEGNPHRQQTCDTHKGNLPLKYNPAQLSHAVQSKIRYKGDGRVDSTDSEFAQQIENVLNLNQTRLVSNRLAVLDEIQRQLSKKTGQRAKSEISQQIEQAKKLNDKGQLRPFSGLILNYLSKRLKKAG
jgi:uncharacterized protein (TIGR02646 family)